MGCLAPDLIPPDLEGRLVRSPLRSILIVAVAGVGLARLPRPVGAQTPPVQSADPIDHSRCLDIGHTYRTPLSTSPIHPAPPNPTTASQQSTMRRIVGLVSLFVLPQAIVGFLAPTPALPQQQRRPARAAPAAAGAGRALGSSLFGGDDLLIGGAGKGGKKNDPAPGEFDLLGASADAAAPVIEQVRGGIGGLAVKGVQGGSRGKGLVLTWLGRWAWDHCDRVRSCRSRQAIPSALTPYLY